MIIQQKPTLAINSVIYILFEICNHIINFMICILFDIEGGFTGRHLIETEKCF